MSAQIFQGLCFSHKTKSDLSLWGAVPYPTHPCSSSLISHSSSPPFCQLQSSDSWPLSSHIPLAQGLSIPPGGGLLHQKPTGSLPSGLCAHISSSERLPLTLDNTAHIYIHTSTRDSLSPLLILIELPATWHIMERLIGLVSILRHWTVSHYSPRQQGFCLFCLPFYPNPLSMAPQVIYVD